MSIQVISVVVLFILGLVMFWLARPRKQRGADWHLLYEAAMSEKNLDVLQTLIYEAESAVQSRQKELRNESYDTPERQELGIAETDLIRLKSEKLRWPMKDPSGLA
jgi:hypothetical protein